MGALPRLAIQRPSTGGLWLYPQAPGTRGGFTSLIHHPNWIISFKIQFPVIIQILRFRFNQPHITHRTLYRINILNAINGMDKFKQMNMSWGWVYCQSAVWSREENLDSRYQLMRTQTAPRPPRVWRLGSPTTPHPMPWLITNPQSYQTLWPSFYKS